MIQLITAQSKKLFRGTKLLKICGTKSFFATKKLKKFNSELNPAFCQYHVICCANFPSSLEYAGVRWENLFFFWRRGKEGREKLFCNLWFCGGWSRLQMCFCLCVGYALLIFGLRYKNYKLRCELYKCGQEFYKLPSKFYKLRC